jgi:glycerol-3-phosphate cytidylyltransferase
MHEAAAGVLVGVFDLFNVEHLDALLAAAARCDDLVVGVVSDDLAERHGHRRPFVPETEREQIIAAVTGVRAVALVTDLASLVDEAGADVVFTLADEGVTDAVAEALADVGDGAPVVPLMGDRVTASAAVRAALSGAAGRSSVA